MSDFDLVVNTGHEHHSNIINLKDLYHIEIITIDKCFEWLHELLKKDSPIRQFRKDLFEGEFDIFSIFFYWTIGSSDTYFTPSKAMIPIISAMEHIFQQYDISSVEGEYFDSAEASILQEICRNKGIPFSINKKISLRSLKSRGVFFAKIICMILRKFYSLSYPSLKKRCDILSLLDKNILLVANGRVINSSLSEQIERKTDRNVFVIDYPAIGKSRPKHMKEFRKREGNFFLEEFMSFPDIRSICRSAEKFRKIWKKYSNKKQFIENFQYQDVNFFHLFKERMDFFFDYYIYFIFLDLKAFKRAISKLDPKIGTSGGFTTPVGVRYFFSLIEKNKAIIVLPHQLAQEDAQWRFLYSMLNKQRFTKYNNHFRILSWNQEHRKFLEKVTGNKDIVLTGSTNYDYIMQMDKNRIKKKVSRLFNLTPDRKILSIGSSHLLEQHSLEYYLCSIFNAAMELGITQIIIKQHPREIDDSQHRRIMKRYPKIKSRITRDHNASEIIAASDAWISPPSTTILEAVCLDKKTIIFDVLGLKNKGNFEHIPCVKDKESLLKCMQDNRDRSEEYRKTIKKYLYKNDGKALERTINSFEDILRKVDKRN